VACFDELAEKGGIAYSFEDIEVTSWSDRGAPPLHGTTQGSRTGSGRRAILHIGPPKSRDQPTRIA
jgi:hypothetical protein